MSILSAEFDIDVAKRVWSDEGREEGREEGKEKERIEIAKNMIADGEPNEKIIRYTGLTREEVEGL